MILLFDVDGVLIHTEMWSQAYSRERGLDHAVMKPFFTGVFSECTIGRADLKEVIVPYLKEWGWEGSVDGYLSAWFDYENHPDTELIEKIQTLRRSGIPCYVATNQERYRLEYLQKNMDFENLFDGIFCSVEMGVKKPDIGYYRKIIDTLRIDPSDIIYYDDAVENIESAKAVGMQAVHYRSIADFMATIDFSV